MSSKFSHDVKDYIQRCKHALERMWLRGVSAKEVEEAIKRGKKIFQKKTKLFEAFHRHFSVVYDEKALQDLRKIFPITVKLW